MERKRNSDGCEAELLEAQNQIKKFKTKQTQKVLAEGAGVSPNVISNLKHGKYKSVTGEGKKVLETLSNEGLVAKLIDNTGKTKKKINIVHSIYLTPSNDKNEESLKLVKKIAEVVKKSYIILSLEFIMLKEHNINEDKEIFDEKKFLNKLSDLNKLLSQDSPRRFKIEEEDIHCFATMIHSGNKLLCTKFGEEIENQSIDIIFEHYKFNKKLTSKLENRDDQTISSDPKSKVINFYESQKIIGDCLYKAIMEKLKESNKVSSDKELKDLYDDFKFLILLPDRTSLEEQTKSRLVEVQKSLPNRLIKDEDLNRIIRISPNHYAFKRQWNDFITEAKTNKNKLYLVIHDECHWASGKEQSAFKFMEFSNGDYHFTEDNKELLPNLFTLMVSATPYNIYTLIEDKTKILNWKDVIEKERGKLAVNGEESSYYGLSELRKQGKIKSDKADSSKYVKSNKYDILTMNGIRLEFIHVLCDYLDALNTFNGESQSEVLDSMQTKKDVKECIQDKKLIVIRVEKDNNNIRQSVIAREVLIKAIKTLELKIEVYINIHSSSTNNVKNKFIFDEHLKKVDDKVRQRKNLSVIKNSLSEETYFSDVEDIPMIMIIIERGRMGDTFPSNCIRFDLRARYLSPVKDFTSIIQDVGRAFGYGRRPVLILSEEADKFLTDIWDTETDGLSMENLKKQTKVLLGKHMKRINKTDGEENEEEAEDQDFSEEECSDLQLVHKIFESDEKNPMFLYDLVPAAFEHRLLLKAEPQNGKTGAFLYLVKLMCESFRTHREHLQLTKNELKEYTKMFYYENSNDQIEELFKTEHGQITHKNYLGTLKYARKKRERKNIVEPAKWAVLGMLDHVKSNCNKSSILVADFGCGDLQFAKFLIQEIEKQNVFLNITFKVVCYDYSTNPIEELKNLPENIFIETRVGINCAKESNFKPLEFDFVISTCALFGNNDSWKPIISTAFYTLKENGIFFLAEKKKRDDKPGLPSEIKDIIEYAGVSVSNYKFNSVETAKTFYDNFTAAKFKKTADYKPEDLNKVLTDIKRN